MFKLFQNFLPVRDRQKTDSAIDKHSYNSVSVWQGQIAQADALWEQGKISEALGLYGLAIEQNPTLLEIQQHLVEKLKQQGNLATAYEKLAIGLKNHGEIEQAAEYYRQAIQIKALTGNTRHKLLGSITSTNRSSIPIASLKEAAFSFQPLVKDAAIVTTEPRYFSKVEIESDNVSPTFDRRLKPINSQQTRDIDWETAQVYLQKALEHMEKREWKQAALCCKQATQITPNMAKAYKIWGNALQRMGKTGEAMTCYAKAVEIQPNLAEVYAGIADIYVQQQKWQQAIKHYQKAIIIKPNTKIYRSLADVWQQLGETEKAELNLALAKELEVDLSAEDGVESIDLETKVETIETQVFPKQLKDDRNYSSYKPKNAETQLDKAIRRYHKQSKLQPNSAKIHTDLGNLYARKGEWQCAIACYRQAIELNHQYAKAHLNLGRILLKLGKRQEFIQEMQLALALQPKIGTALDRFHFGNALVEDGKPKQAINLYYKAIDLDPRFVRAYYRISEILSQQSKHAEAIEFLEQSINHNPQDPESYYLLGQQWEALENWEKAVQTYSQVLRLNPQFPEALRKLNYALAQKLKLNRKFKTKSLS